MLSVGYFENSKMGVSFPPYPERDLCLQLKYHDDGEKTLGPTVASISLGCSSIMEWRPKASVNVCGKTKTNNKRKEKKEVLKILLEHGDIMIMHGAKIQKLYEVCDF